MGVNITQELDFLGAYQTCLKAMETDEFTGSLCKYYLEITEALRIAMKNQSKPKGEALSKKDKIELALFLIIGFGIMIITVLCSER